ncbi:MAG: hypothetical protein GEU93_20420 [Propionibacteriales bacterium]|nr:hypothetical protein [Propionibacteriales bacterium]
MVDAERLSGVHVALATPIEPSGELDRAGLRGLLDRVLDGGIFGICPTGSTGEGPRLTRAQRREVLRAVREHVGDEPLVVPAPSGLTSHDVIDELEEFSGLGADAALIAVPSYFPMAEPDVLRYYQAVADSAAIPFLIYNIPPMTGVSVPPWVVGELASHPKVVGIKDSSRDFEYFEEVVYATAGSENFAVLTGSDTMLLASMVVGGDGTIAASANFVPELGVGVYSNVQKEDWPEAHRLQRRLFEVVRTCRAGVPPGGWKAALEHAGVCSRRLVPPADPLSDAQYTQLVRRLVELGYS